jgi:hypothetical protein
VQHDMQLRAAARVLYDEEHVLASPVPFEAAERLRSRAWRAAVEAAIEDRASMADTIASMAQMPLF